MFFRQIKSRRRSALARQAKTHLGHEHLEERALLAVYIGDVVSGDIESFDASGASQGSFAAGLAAEDYLLSGNVQGGSEHEVVVGDASTGDARIYRADGLLLNTINIQLMPGNGFALGDVNNDGFEEFIVANDITGFITVHDNTGAIQTVFVGGFTSDDALAAGDVNANGFDEILTANNGTGAVTMFNAAGTNLGSFAAGFITGGGFDVGNTNGFGGEDILVANPITGEVESYAVTGALQDSFGSPYRLGDGFSVDNANGIGLDEIGVAAGTTGMVTLFNSSGGVVSSFAAGFDTGDLLALGGSTQTIIEGEDRFEPNDTIATATVLGSIPEITLRELSIHKREFLEDIVEPDIDFFKITANQTGKLVINVFFNPDGGNLDTAVVDIDGTPIQLGVPSGSGEQIILPVVSQEMYFLRIAGVDGDVNTYELEIENFAVPVPTGVHLDPASDTGMMSGDNVTADSEPRLFIQTDVLGFVDDNRNNMADDAITVLTAAEAVAGDTAGVAVQVTWINTSNPAQTPILGYASPLIPNFPTVYHFTPNSPLPDGVYFVSSSANIFDGQTPNETGRSTVSAPLWITIDTEAPSADAPDMLASSDTGLSSTDNITSINTPAFVGMAESNAKVRIYAENVDTGVNGLVGQGVANYDGTWEITIEPLADATYDMTVRVEDAAGELSDPSDPLRIHIDIATPQRPTIDLIDSDDTGSFDLDNVTIGDPTQGDGIADFRISGEVGSTVFVKDGEVIIDTFVFDGAFDLTDGVMDNFGIRTIDFNANEAAFNIPTEGPHPLSTEATDITGNFTQSEQLLVTVDFTAPVAPPAPNLLASSDSGLLDDDNVTNILSPAFDGHGEANAIVRVFAMNVDTGSLQLIGQGVVNSDESDGVPDDGLGTWEVTVEPLVDGTYDITVELEDLAGNVSPRSEALQITIDTADPQRPTIDLIDADDTGSFDLDDVTIGDPTQGDGIADFRISAEMGSTVFVKDGEVIVDTLVFDAAFDLTDGVLDNFGVRTIDFNANEAAFNIPSEGPHPLSTEATDTTGNFTQSEQLLVTVDFTAPVAPLTPNLLTSSDSGMVDDDNVTNKMSPAFDGRGEANAIVRVYATNVDTGFIQLVGEGIINSDESDGVPDNGLGTWEVTVEPLVDATYDITVEFEDLAGNVSPLSEPLQISIDTAVPNTPLLDLLSASDSGRNDVDNVTNDDRPTVTVSANDAVDANDNPVPHDIKYRIYLRPDGDLSTGEILIVDSYAALGDFTTDEFFTHTLSMDLNNPVGTPMPEGVHNLKLEVEDRAGNISPDFLLTVTVDQTAPEKSFGDPDVFGDGLAPDSDTGIIGQPELSVDRITSDTVPTFWGHAEADAIVTAYVVVDDSGTPLDPTDDVLAQIGKTVAIPLDGNDAYPEGLWELTSTRDLNDPSLGLGVDGQRTIVITAEDLAGNVTQRMSLDIFIDTAGPRVFEVIYPDGRDVLGPKPTDGPTELTDQIIVGFQDQTFADPEDLGAELTANQEVVPSDSTGMGYGSVTINEIAGTLDVDLFITDIPLALVTGAHIHLGDPGVAGNVLVDLLASGAFVVDGVGIRYSVNNVPLVNGMLGLSIAEQIEAIQSSGTYFNVHTPANPAGAIRGQIAPPIAYPAVNPQLALDPGNYSIVGDANGFQLIESVEFVVPDGFGGFVSGDPTDGTTWVRIETADYLPDDRLTLTVFDRIMDNAGNALDGDIRPDEPGEAADLLPSGDGVPGEDFQVRFTVDSRPEIGTWSSASFYIDTNGNFIFDPENLDDTNEDIVYKFGFTSDNPVAGSFVSNPVGITDGFDRLAVYGDVGTSFDDVQYRWLVDFDNDGVPDDTIFDPANINGLPVAGEFDGNPLNGDEVGVFDGTTWHLDTDHDFRVDQAFGTDLRGYPIVGDFDGNGLDDLATWNEAKDRFQIDLDGGVLRGWDGTADQTFTVDFAGIRDLPVAADFDQDGIDDLGLWVPDRSGATPDEAGEWYIMVSNGEPVYDRGPVAEFDPQPFGSDLFAQFGDKFALPIVGNFDPPVGSATVESVAVAYTNQDNPADVDHNGTVSPTDALAVIQALDSGAGLEAATEAASSTVYLDVNADGYLSPTDILAVIQQLDSATPSAAPVAEAVSSTETTSTIYLAPRQLDQSPVEAGEETVPDVEDSTSVLASTSVIEWGLSTNLTGSESSEQESDEDTAVTDAALAAIADEQDGWNMLL